MSWFLGVFVLLSSTLVFGHGGDDGPATLEQEFSKQSHTDLPIIISSIDGITFGYELGRQPEAEHHDEHGFHFEAHPMISGGIDRIVRSVCLEQAAPSVLESCSDKAPYLLFENKKWDLGIGGETHTHLPLSFGVGVGVGFFKGKNYFSYRVLNSKDEKRAALKFPRTEEEFQNWRVGDQLSFMSKGTVLLSVVFGIEPLFHMGPEFSHTGVHRISVKKVTEDKLLAEVSIIKSNSLGLESSSVFTNGGFTGSKGGSKTFTYEFNMREENAFEVFEYFLAARLDLVNRMVVNGKTAVMLKNELKNHGRTLSGSFGFPVFFFNGGYRGSFFAQGTMDIKEDGEVRPHEVFTSSKMRDHYTRGVVSDHFWENQNLVTTILREVSAPDESIMSVVLNWTYSRDHFKSKEFTRKMKKLSRLTGSDDFTKLRIPSDTDGYLKVDVTINFNAHEVLQILSGPEKKELEVYQEARDYAGMNKLLLKFMNEAFDRDLGNIHPHVLLKIEGETIKKTVFNF